ncbi:MAG TPA: hypothetical protein DCX07_04325, partial [Phycisphaerales bacterium]|nr:hypothetical protein [Phycisphaerales bacterium]
VQSGGFDAAILATETPEQLDVGLTRALLSMQSDLPVVFLVPDREAASRCPALRGATFDQIHDLSWPGVELVKRLENEIDSTLAGRPEYTVIFVDDDEDFLGSLEELLARRLEKAASRFRIHAEFYESPLEALKFIVNLPPERLSVIVCDQIMPEMKGVEFLNKVKVIRPRCHRVLLTGYAGLDSAIAAINDRVLDKYLTKPIEQPVDFVNAVVHLVQEYHLRISHDAERSRLLSQFEIIRAISATSDIHGAIETITGWMAEHMPSWQPTVLLTEGQELVVDTGCVALLNLIKGQRLPADHSLFCWLRGSRHPVFATTRQRLLEAVPGLDVSQDFPVALSPLDHGAQPLGVLLLAAMPGMSFNRNERILVNFMADVASVALRGLRDREKLETLYVATMGSLMETVEAKDHYTRGHTERVRELAVALGEAAGMDPKDLKDLQYAAELHDIGKIAVPDAIIAKPGRLTGDEFAIMQEHPRRGDKILQHLKFLDHARMIVRSHHERYDGTGYPDGLKGEEIPLGARILAIADSYDAMTSARPYRDAMSADAALAEIQGGAGRQFDPRLAALFTTLLETRHSRENTDSEKNTREERT